MNVSIHFFEADKKFDDILNDINITKKQSIILPENNQHKSSHI